MKTPDFLSATLERHSWNFAKTMPKNPHYYTRKRDWESQEQFTECAHLIRKYGKTEMFRKWPYICFNFNGYKYWVMDKNPDDAVIINRKPLKKEAF
tara:strand:+ start:1547 stop:1834 length:288 start_codon:yes stop_codon:yes gene_type:complete